MLHVCLYILILHIVCFHFTFTVILLHSSPQPSYAYGKACHIKFGSGTKLVWGTKFACKTGPLRPKLTAILVRPHQFWSRFNTKAKCETEDRRIQNIYKDIEAIENEFHVKARQTQ